MKKQDITIAVVDNDESFRNSLKKYFDSEGYTCLTYSDHDKLLANIKLRNIDIIIMECLTQKISLNQSVTNILSETKNNPPFFIFVSFILDKASVNSVLIQTKSPYFFKKPVQPKDLDTIIKSRFTNLDVEEKDDFIELLRTPQITTQERLTTIKNLKSIHGFEIPRLLSYLLRTSFYGKVGLKEASSKDYSILFQNGKIIKAEIYDPKSFFGALLVDKDFITIEQLETIQNQKSTKRIGERLIEANFLSPHVIDIINLEQLGIRMGYVIKNINYEINIEENTSNKEELSMDLTDFQKFIGDWLNSKITTDWLRTFFLPFMDQKIIRASQFADISSLHNVYPLNRMPRFAQEIISGSTINEYISQKKYPEEDILKAIYLLSSQEYISFDNAVIKQNSTQMVEHLKKINLDMSNKNHFEVLGLQKNAKSAEIKKSYYDLSKLFHPDRVSKDASSEIRDLTSFVFSKISKAYETLSDETKKGSYLLELEKGLAEKILESESLFEEGKVQLKGNQITKALEYFEKAISLRPPSPELKLHYLWAKALLLPKENITEHLNHIESELGKIPSEDRHNSIYYFIKAIYLKHIGDLTGAEKNIKHALSLTPNFIEAKRELNIISLQKKGNKTTNIFEADLKDVVGMLFKRKK